MWPVLFTLPEGLPLIGGLQIQSFGVLLFSAFITTGWFARREMVRKGLDPERTTDLTFWAIVGGLLGSKLYSAFSNPAALAADPFGQIFSGSGFTWYGGLILATVFVWIYMRVAKLPVGATFDTIAVGLPMGIAVGRIGCFMAGDDYGRPTDVAWGVAFPNGAPPTTVDVLTNRYGLELDPAFIERFGQVVPVHPTQLYEVALSLVIFALMWKWRLHKHSDGWLFAAWLGVYGVSRFLLETVRLKSDRFLFDTFTGAQVISALLIIASIALTQRLSNRNKAT
jgi:phosphatidylglycerol:prolipoprotein diacylglycerol transferase